jgi:four helix bundle protein
MAATNKSFLPQQGAYKQLIVFKLATCIYALTYAVAHRYFSRGDRTIDQMVQAARSGKQNIAEGSVAATTSREMELKLTNVAKASMHELLLDYEDYLMTHNLQ